MIRYGSVAVNEETSKCSVNGQMLKFVNVYKDLGVWVNSRLKFHEHVNFMCGKAAGLNLVFNSVQV